MAVDRLNGAIDQTVPLIRIQPRQSGPQVSEGAPSPQTTGQVSAIRPSLWREKLKRKIRKLVHTLALTTGMVVAAVSPHIYGELFPPQMEVLVADPSLNTGKTRHELMARGIPRDWDWSKGWGGFGRGVTAIATVPSAETTRFDAYDLLFRTMGSRFDSNLLGALESGKLYIPALQKMIQDGYWNHRYFFTRSKPVQAGDPLPSQKDLQAFGLGRFVVFGSPDMRRTHEASDAIAECLKKQLPPGMLINQNCDASGPEATWGATLAAFEQFVDQGLKRGILNYEFNLHGHGLLGPPESQDPILYVEIGGKHIQGGGNIPEDFIRASLQSLVQRVEQKTGHRIHLIYINQSCHGGESITDDTDVSSEALEYIVNGK